MKTEIIDVLGEEHVIVDRGNGEFTSMPKAIYDAQQEALANGHNPLV